VIQRVIDIICSPVAQVCCRVGILFWIALWVTMARYADPD
jgi:hypothetical protein